MGSDNNSNFKQAFWLGLGQLCSFALSFISAAILSRYFDKQEYGTYKQILYIYNILFSLFSMGLPSVFAFFIPRLNTGQQKTLIKGLNSVFVLLGIVFSVALFALSTPISIVLKNSDLADGLKLFAIFPLFTLPTLGVEGIYTAIRKTKEIAVYHIVSKLLMLICIVLPVLIFHTSYKGAVIGWGVASFAIFIYAMFLKNRPYYKIQPEVVPNMYKSIFDYSLPLLGAFVFGFIINAADQFFVSRFYGTETFAEYSNGCLSIPVVAMVATSVKNVLLPVFSKAEADNNMKNALQTYYNAANKSVTLVYPILFFFMFFSVDSMVFLYGAKYAVSGKYLQCFMLRDFVNVFPYFSILLAKSKTSVYMYIHLVGCLFVWLFDTVCVYLGLPAFCVLLIGSSFQILSAFYGYRYIHRNTGLRLLTKSSLIHIAKVASHCIVVLIVVSYLVQSLLAESLPIVRLLFGSISFYIIIFLSGKLVKVDYFESIKLLKRS